MTKPAIELRISNLNLGGIKMANNRKVQKSLLEMATISLSKRYEFKYNIVTGVTSWKKKGDSNDKILDDYDLNSILLDLHRRNIEIQIGLLRNLLKSNFVPIFDPFQEYFDSLPLWDQKTDFIHLLASTVKTTNDELWNFYFKKWIVAMVACLLDKNIVNHTMLVFSGEQGVGKTTFALNLLPMPLKDYSYSGTIDPNNKDTLIHLAEKMLINVDELEDLGKQKLHSLKQLITKDSAKMRKVYGSFNENLPRRASFIASVNSNKFMHDITGNRRLLGVEVIGQINNEHKIPLDGVYSQALFLWKNKFQYWFDRNEIDIVNKSNENYRVKSLVEELLFKHFSVCTKDETTDSLTASDILSILFENNINGQSNGNLQQLGKLLQSHKFLKIKRAGKQLYLLKRQAVNNYAYQPESHINQEL